MVRMDELLQNLRKEMIGLRTSSSGLTKQMWLLYVTFEDFVCLHHPKKSQDLISSSIDIDNYLDPKSLQLNTRNLITCAVSDLEGRETLSENQEEAATIATPNRNSERKPACNKSAEPLVQPGLFTEIDNGCDNCDLDNVIVSYRFAKKHHISSLCSHENSFFKTIKAPNGVKHSVTMALSRPDRRARSADKMRDYTVQSTKQKLRDLKSSHCVSKDKPGYPQEFCSVFGNHQLDAQTRDCVLRQKQTGKLSRDNGRHNPDLFLTSKCTNNGDALLRSNCTGHEDRLKTAKSNPRGQRKTHQSHNKTTGLRETQERDTSLINRINDLCWGNDSSECNETKTGQTDARVNLAPQRPTVLFNDNDRSLGDLKRSNDLVSPRSDTTITPDSSRCPKRHCLVPTNHEDPALLSPESGLDRTRSLWDSFDQVMSPGSQFDDPVPSTSNNAPRVHSNDSSPVTISSGYESDSLPTCEADIDKIFVKRNKRKTKTASTEPTTDYFSLSETYPTNLNASVTDMGYKPQQPPKVIVTRVPEKVLPHSTDTSKTRVIDNANTISVPDKFSVRNIRATEGNFHCQLPLKPRRQILPDNNQTQFSPAQRNNYQLTKVARSMFQIIHDLQIEQEAADNKKKCRKVKRAPAFKGEPTTPTTQTNDNNQAEVASFAVTEACTQGDIQDRIQDVSQMNSANQSIADSELANKGQCPISNFSESKADNFAANVASSGLPRPQGKFIVKCVRRPLGSNPADFARDLPHSSSAVDYLQDENSPSQNSAIPNLNAIGISSHVHMTSGVRNWNSNVSTSSPNMNHFAEAERIPFVMNDCSPYATSKIPGCCTPKRDDRLDDHVYETIPGDELLYAEFLRLRELGLLPKRLNRIPDHPVHFIPFDPPALPARNNENTPNEKPNSARSRNRKPPAPPASQTRCVRKPMTDRARQPMMRSISWEGKHAFDPDLSVQSVPDKYMTNPGNRTDDHSRKWSPGDEFNYVEGVRQPPPKRRENFYLLLQNKQKRAEISQSLELETKLKELGLVFDERFKGKHTVDADGYTTVDDDLLPMEHPQDRGQVFLKSTFV